MGRQKALNFPRSRAFCLLRNCGIALLAKYVILKDILKYTLIAFVGVFGIIMITLYAPADTEEVPIISKKIRRQKQFLSYISFLIGVIIAIFTKNNVISNIIIFGYFAQTCMITRFAYKITNNKYGYELYENMSN